MGRGLPSERAVGGRLAEVGLALGVGLGFLAIAQGGVDPDVLVNFGWQWLVGSASWLPRGFSQIVGGRCSGSLLITKSEGGREPAGDWDCGGAVGVPPRHITTNRGGSGISRMQPTFPRLSTCRMLVDLMDGAYREAVDDCDMEVTVEVRVRAGV